MINWNESKNRILIGFHDLTKKKSSLLDNKYPLEFEPDKIPFLVTRDSYYEVSPKNTLFFLERKDKQIAFDEIVNKVSNSLVIPGLFVSILYLLKYVGILEQIVFLETFLDSPIINTLFWIAFFGGMILWHQHYSSKPLFNKLPKAPLISDSEMEDILHNGIQFSRLGHLNITKYVSDEFLNVIEIEKKDFSIFRILTNLLSLEEVQIFLKKADLSFTKEELEKYKLSENELPKITKIHINQLLLYSLEEALITKSSEIEPIHLFLTLIKILPSLNKGILKQDSSLGLLREVAGYIIYEKSKEYNYGYLNPLVPYHRTGGIAKSWIYGYTYILNQFSKDINEEVANQSDLFGIGHEREVENLIAVLGRPNKKNALLIGEPGVGKSSMIKGIAQRINRGDVPPILNSFRIIQLDINGLISFASGKTNIEAVIQKAMNELSKAGNVILYIDQLQELVPAKAQETGHSIADILLPYVLEGKFGIVGTVNYSDYKKYFYTNESFRQSFSNIEIPEASAKDSLRILQSKIKHLEKTFNIEITFPSLISCVELAQRYVHNRMLPDSASSLLEDTCSWAKSNGVSVITTDHIAKVVSLQTNINIGDISTAEATQLISLEERINSKVLGQEDAVHIISESLRRARADVRDPKKPIGSFLFIGPTGVGKTYLAKTVSNEYFNNDEDIVRVDMSEYSNPQSISKLLGSSSQNQNEQSETTLLDRVKSNPYTVVLFDEIEKADRSVLDLFLQIFDEGRLTSSKGETVDFTNTIIICTSNIAANMVLKSLETNQMWEETKNRVIIELKQAIRPELFNRFDGIVVFHPQNQEVLSKIANKLLEELYKRMHEKSIELDWNETIPMLIANKAYEPGFGARPIKRYIQEKIEGQIATMLINGELNAGDSLNIKESWIV